MGRKTVALHLDEDIYNRYKAFCEKHAIVLSRKVERFMEKEMEESKNGEN
jgi:hypothetical protein